MAKISGYLKDGAGQAVVQCAIILEALKTSNQVIEKIESYTTTKDGFYEINALTGQYQVTLTIDGHPPKKVGVITVYKDSANGTLNDFLANGITNDDITPLLLSQLIEERKQAQQAAELAKNSATQASTTLSNTVKKTGETSQSVNGTLSATILQENGQRVYSSKNKPTASDLGVLPLSGGTMSGPLDATSYMSVKGSYPKYILKSDVNEHQILSNPAGDFYFYLQDKDKNADTRLKFNAATSKWEFISKGISNNGVSVVFKGDYGLGAIATTNLITDSIEAMLPTGFYISNNVVTGNTPHLASNVIIQNRNSNLQTAIAVSADAKEPMKTGGYYNGAWVWQESITTANSTVDSNGFYKKASPICRLFANDNINEVDSFKLAGCGLVNSEADGVSAKRIAVGHYEIHDSLGFAKSGWYIETPQDANGNKKLFVEYETAQNNVITVKTYQNCFENGRFVAGEPMDIPDGRWIDLRLLMPETLAE